MPLTYADTHQIDAILSNVMASTAPSEVLIADLALPPVDVDPKNFAGKIEVESSRPLMGQGHHVNLRRGDLDPYPRLGTAGSSLIDYRCQELAAASALSKRQLDRELDPEKRKRREAAIVASAILLQQEKDVAALLFDGANWGANTAALTALSGGSTKKFGASGAAEFSDLMIAKELARNSAHGANPDAFLIGISAFNVLRRAVEFRAYGSTAKSRIALPEAEVIQVLQEVLGVNQVLVGRARSETAATGAASSEADIWTDNCLFYWNRPSVSEASGGLTSSPISALAIRERLNGGAAGFGAFEIWSANPPMLEIAGGLSRTQVMLYETDNTQQPGVALPPPGFLVTDCV